MSYQSNQTRLQKWLSQQGISSRRQAEQLMLEGRVSVNGKKIKELGFKVEPGRDHIVVDGQTVPNVEVNKLYWLLWKPLGCITSTSDPEGRATIFHLDSLEGRKPVSYTHLTLPTKA